MLAWGKRLIDLWLHCQLVVERNAEVALKCDDVTANSQRQVR